MDTKEEEMDVVVSTSMPINSHLNTLISEEEMRCRRPSNCPTLSDNRDWRDSDGVQGAYTIPTMARDCSYDTIPVSLENPRTVRHASLDELKPTRLTIFEFLIDNLDRLARDDKKSTDDMAKLAAQGVPVIFQKKFDRRYAASSSSVSENSLRGSLGAIFSSKSHHRSPSERARADEDLQDSNTQIQTQSSMSESVYEISISGDAFRVFSNTVLAEELQHKPVQVNVCWRQSSINVKIALESVVKDVIASVVNDMQLEISKFTTPGVDLIADSSSFLLGKVDHNSPGLRTWLNPDTTIAVYDIKQGDELLLKHISDIEIVTIAIPAQNSRSTLEYKFDLLVSEAIATLRLPFRSAQSEEKERFGLYCPHFGMWLDETKTLFSYNLTQATIIQLRELANEFLLRIYLPDFDQKIAIKALPSLLVSDVMLMIQCQLQNRKLKLAINGQYGLFILSSKTWMQLDSTIEKYEAIKTESIHMRIQYQLVVIQTPYGDTNLPVDEKMIVRSILDILQATHPRADHDRFALHLPTNERLKDTESMWSILKEISSIDKLRYRLSSQKIHIVAEKEDAVVNTNSVEVEVDFSEPLESLVHYFCRRLGIRYRDFFCIKLDGGPALDQEKSLMQLDILTGSRLVVFWKNYQESSSTDENNMGVWDEVLSPDTIHMDSAEPTKIISATLNKLVEKLTEEKGQGTTAYLDFVKTFLLTYQSFTTADVLLQKLSDRYAVPNLKGLSWPEFDKFRTTVQLRVCNVLLQWSKKYTWDFVHPQNGHKICKDFLHFIDTVLAFEHASMAKQIRKNIFKLSDGSAMISTKQLQSSWKSTLAVRTNPNGIVFGYSVEDIAQQLTMIEGCLYSVIMPSELLGQAWTKKDAITRAPGITALTRRFNAIACWVGWAILEGKTPRLRAERLTKLIDITQCLFTIGNFSTLMAIIAGINKAAISRLKLTHKELPAKSAKRLSELEKMMSAQGSYKNYRASIRATTPPCIPYIG
ncbi:hypothetical protein BASA60_010721 [Batrachochytrium salamandrivorans]|nr:hypothetical protein BASA60_010721 [Batrachochytrium salamandrivorans]